MKVAVSTPFHNSINLKGEALINFEAKVMKQNETILAFFKHYKEREFTPWEAHALLAKHGYSFLITSVRRGINQLTEHGELNKLNEAHQKLERYRCKNYTWQYNPDKLRI